MSEKYRIVVADRISPSGLSALLEDARFEVIETAGWEEDAVHEALGEARGLLVRSATTVSRTLLEHAPRLKVIGRAGVGVDNIDLAAATERGIPVLNAPAGNTVAAAELTMALLLSLVRMVPAADRSMRSGEWKRSAFGGVELRGRTLGLIGAGRIGGEVARRARAFEMNVIVSDPYLTTERAEELGVKPVSLDALLDDADVISLHVPLVTETEGLIDADALRRMKPTAYLVNVARGGVVDEAALAAALAAGDIAGAALDVYENEPLEADSPLRGAPNLVLTPHLGASTTEAQELVATEIAEAVRGALLEGDLSRAVNAPAIGGEALRRVRPLLELAEKVGRLAIALAPGPVRAVEIRYAGESSDATKPLSASLLRGLLARIVGPDDVNFVNALHLAEVRGIHVSTAVASRDPDYPELVEVALRAERGSVEVAGTLLGDRHPRIVRIDDYVIDLVPEGTMIVLHNRDVPGVIGKVGTLLGSLGLNIAGYHQSRLAPGGSALAAVSVDGAVTPKVIEALRGLPEVSQVHMAELE
ncbi:MAG: phosphoglycerate dehydrogenase [Gemmatimonadota bacterium]